MPTGGSSGRKSSGEPHHTTRQTIAIAASRGEAVSFTWAEAEACFPDCSPAWDRDVNNGKTAWDDRWSPDLEVSYNTLWATGPLYGFRVTRFAFDGEHWIDNAEGERRAMLRERIRREGGWPDTMPDMLHHIAGCRSLHDWHVKWQIVVTSCRECNGGSRLVVSRSDKERRVMVLADDFAHGRVFLRDQGPMLDEMRAAFGDGVRRFRRRWCVVCDGIGEVTVGACSCPISQVDFGRLGFR